MNTVYALVLALVAALALAGCAVVDRVDSVKDRVGDRAAAVVVDYCERASDADQDALRERMDERTAPHTVRVDCAR